VHKWSPDELFGEAVAVTSAAGWEPAVASQEAQAVACVDADGFRADYSVETIADVLARLDSAEREKIHQRIAAEIRAQLEQDQERRDQERLRVQEGFLEELSVRMGEMLTEQTLTMASGAAELAIAVAEQILRTTVTVDRDVLIRGLETIVYKVRSGSELTVTANPADRDFLNAHPEALEKLNISRVIADPRIKQGGCLVAADGCEWDLTLENRLAVLGDVVRTSLQGCVGEDPDG